MKLVGFRRFASFIQNRTTAAGDKKKSQDFRLGKIVRCKDCEAVRRKNASERMEKFTVRNQYLVALTSLLNY